MSVSLLVSSLPYGNLVNIGISPALDDISFRIFEDNLAKFLDSLKLLRISYISVSLLVGVLPYWNYIIIGISSVLYKIHFVIFFRHSWDISELFQIILSFLYVCQSLVFQSVCQCLLSFPIGISGSQLLRPLVLLYDMPKTNQNWLVFYFGQALISCWFLI